MALAVCLLEHLLEYHFDLIFPRVRKIAKTSPRFAWMVQMVAIMGQAAEPKNRAAIKRLQRMIFKCQFEGVWRREVAKRRAKRGL